MFVWRSVILMAVWIVSCFLLVPQSRVGLFIRTFTSSLCATKRDLQGNRVIPDGLVEGWPVHAPLLETCAGSLKDDKGQWSYLSGLIYSPRHNTASKFSWGMLDERKPTDHCLSPFRLFSERGPIVFLTDWQCWWQFPCPQPGRRYEACSSALNPDWDLYRI